MLSIFFSFLNFINGVLAVFLPPLFQLVFWAAVAGASSMFIYSKISPQVLIKDLVDQRNVFQKQLLSLDAEFDEFLKSALKSLGYSFRILKAIFVPTILASLPALVLACWMHVYFSYEPSTEEQTIVTATLLNGDPISDFEAIFEDNGDLSEGGKRFLTIKVSEQTIYSGNPFVPPTAGLYKKKWWNFIIPNSAGYLVPGAPIDALKLKFSSKKFFQGGPEWARTWEVPFFFCTFLFALIIKIIFKIK
ncbi:MAG TPA: hypothetical protein PLY88_07515 [Candidatus Omnitrophota bacterium]|nr:hypothetical protein [Candidatus Omnitrophota bacterium]